MPGDKTSDAKIKLKAVLVFDLDRNKWKVSNYLERNFPLAEVWPAIPLFFESYTKQVTFFRALLRMFYFY